MQYAFSNSKFNQDISKWDVSNVRDMSSMFEYAKKFKQNLTNWDVSNVTYIEKIFKDSGIHREDVKKWNWKLPKGVTIDDLF